jgi:hypothetical protein
MVDDVARALCEAAGRSTYDALDHPPAPVCMCCDRLADGRRVCTMWTSFRQEARAAIKAAYQWNRRERRWPSFASEP